MHNTLNINEVFKFKIACLIFPMRMSPITFDGIKRLLYKNDAPNNSLRGTDLKFYWYIYLRQF